MVVTKITLFNLIILNLSLEGNFYKKMAAFKSFPKLKTQRLTLRRLKETDNNDIFFLRSDKKVMKYIKRIQLNSLEEANDFIHRIDTQIMESTIFYWAITINNNPKLIGTICLWNFSKDKKTAEIGYDLNPKYHRQGIMNEAMQSVLGFGFKMINLETIEAFTHKNNNNSIKLLIKNDFTLSKNRKDNKNINNVIFANKTYK